MGNPVIREKIREIIGLEFIFYKDYNLLIYSKTILPNPELKDNNNNNLNNSKNLVNFSDIDKKFI